MIDKDLIDLMTKNFPWVIISAVWGFVHYIYKLDKKENFSFTRMVINIVVAGWIGYLCQELNISSVYTAIAWFCAYPLLNLIERKGAKIISEIIFKND